jgi:hypothetical protein
MLSDIVLKFKYRYLAAYTLIVILSMRGGSTWSPKASSHLQSKMSMAQGERGAWYKVSSLEYPALIVKYLFLVV